MRLDRATGRQCRSRSGKDPRRPWRIAQSGPRPCPRTYRLLGRTTSVRGSREGWAAGIQSTRTAGQVRLGETRAWLLPSEQRFEEVNKKGSDGALGGSGYRRSGRWRWLWRRRRFRFWYRRDLRPRERDGRIQLHHHHQQARTAGLLINGVRVIYPIPDVLPRHILVRPGPDVGRRLPAGGVAEAVIPFEHCKRPTDRPVLVSGGIGRAAHQGINGSFFPRLERTSASRDVG